MEIPQIPNKLTSIALVFLLLFTYVMTAQTPDFKVQHIQDDIGRNGGTNTSFTTVGSLSSAVELANNNRKTHAGSPTNSGNRPGDDMAGARQLTNVNILTYYRESSSDNRDMRFNTSIWEYIGPSGGGNELIVRGRYAVSLNGGTNSVTQTLSGITNANKCIPFITGIMNNTTSQDADSGTALAYLENATTLRVQKGSNGNNVTVYITLVEFTGNNWTVLHGDSGNSNSDTGTITLRDGSDGTGTATNVSSWSDAAIFSHFRADNTSSGSNDAISDLWPVTEPGSNNQRVDWTFHSNHDSSSTNRHFVHVLGNTGLNVTRFQDNDNSSGESKINITSAGLTDINQALIVGSSTSSGKGTAYGRGWRNYYLNSITEAAHWAHRSGNSVSHEIQIIDLSGLQTSFVGPEINLKGNGVDIPDGNTIISLSDDTDFGGIEVTGAVSVSHTFTIQNFGSTDVILTDPSPYITITGATGDFTLTANPSATISSGGSTTFTITYDPTTSGTHVATISIANDDSDENPYTFLIEGRGEYCASNGSTTYDTSVTYVSFNTISNADNEIPKDNAYEDFTNLSTNIYKSSTHNLTVNVNTDGNYTIYTNVWIDWNRDGDFDDAGEEYDMGSATNVVDGPTSNSPMAITVPIGATIGTSRMRVATKYATYPSSCDSGFDGEVEDYSVNVIDYLIDFNGIDEHIDLGDNHDLTGSFSLEAWVLQETAVATGTILSKGNIDASLKTGYHLSLKNNYPNLIWYDNSNNEVLNMTSPYAIPNNKWHHIAATYDGLTVKMYIDGIEVISSSPLSPPIDTSHDFIIGSDLENFSTTPLNMNYFDGAIQEVRIWDVVLSEAQIRNMMNQHIEQNSANVKGLETKTDISGGLLWSSLRGYYPLDSNTAFDSSSYNIEGIPENIDSSQNATAPLPYETDDDTSWDTSTTWLNNSDVYIPNTMGVNGVTMIDWNIVELTNDISSGDRDISLNGLVSIVGTLTISDPNDPQDETNSGQALTVTNYLEIDGVIDLVGESQLIQTDGSIIDADSGGFIERDQQGTANGFNYNYWSSSVGPITGNSGSRGMGIESTNSNYTIFSVLNDGTDSSAYDVPNFDSLYTAADSNTPTTPRTLSTYWMYRFYGPLDNYYAWTSIDENSSLLPGEGFTMKGTSGSTTIDTNQNYVFKGLPNNGDITLPLDKSSGDVERLVGNPYPSAIDATEFILDNLSIADGGNNINGTVINGALYFWDHFSEENSHYLKDYVGGYATYNLTGGTAAISNDARINNTSNAGSAAVGTKVPGQYIPVNQGFFVSTALDGHLNDNTPQVAIATVDGGNIVFKNSQRVFVTEIDPESSFLRTNGKKKTKAANENNRIVEQRSAIRIIYDSPKGYHRQLLLGVDSNASKGFDLGYDAFMVDVNEEDMYWDIEGGKFVIQGINSLDNAQEFPLGLIVEESGLISIRIEELENIDPSTSIYIKDKDTGENFKINNEIFSLKLNAGTYNDRFSMVFQQQDTYIESDLTVINHGLLAYYDSNVSKIKITNTHDIDLNNLTIYNLAGQEVLAPNIDASTKEVVINVSDGIYLLKFNSSSHGIINKKIIVK